VPRYIWGVDSAATVTEELYTFVRNKFGNPKFWGRYLSEVPKLSEGLTKGEISFIRNKGIKLLPIYSVYREATGYLNGQTAARNAVFHSRRLGIPENTALLQMWRRIFLLMKHGYEGGLRPLFQLGTAQEYIIILLKGIFQNHFVKQ